MSALLCSSGGKVVSIGNVLVDEKMRYIAPCIVANVREDMALMHEEVTEKMRKKNG